MESRACAFHFEYDNWRGIEFYVLETGGVFSKSQSFWSPEYKQRVDCCIISLDALGTRVLHTTERIDQIKFPFYSPSLKRSELTPEEKVYFAERGVKVVSLDKIS